MQIVDGKPYIDQVTALIKEYTGRLNRNLDFQHLDEELKDPAAKYTAPAGELLAAVEDGVVLGIVAYHKHSDLRCEMKRLYVSPKGRGRLLGEKLVAAIIDHAKAAGFKEMVLDTLPHLQAAVHLYEKFGFERCEAYYYNPMPDVLYFRKKLR